jgi:hypothetical protein
VFIVLSSTLATIANATGGLLAEVGGYVSTVLTSIGSAL